MKSPLINFVHLCDSAFFSQEGKLNLIGIFKMINVANLPASHPKMTIVLDVNIEKSMKLKIQILKKETGETIAKLEGKLDRKGEEKGEKEMCFISDFNNVKFEETGEYRVEIWIGDELCEIIPFSVNKVRNAK